MGRRKQHNPRPGPVARGGRREQKEPLLEQLSSFIGFFVYLLVLKSFFLPLFVIPTGSMAETLCGLQAQHTCPNCGTEYPVGLAPNGELPGPIVQCPNCRWREHFGSARERAALQARGLGIDGSLRAMPRARGGDRIMVHGWPYELGGAFQPQRWDVVVFKVPKDGQTNYIKRLIGKPGETVEIIDGDIFITHPDTGQTHIARKTETPHVQRSLWFPYYNHDYPPRGPSPGAGYYPRWVAMAGKAGWSGVRTRRPRFDGLNGAGGELRFVTAPGQTQTPGRIQDVYGYNTGLERRRDRATDRGIFVERLQHHVTDVRLSCEVTIEAIAEGGFVELSATKHGDRFFARLHADGRVTLEHESEADRQPKTWGEARPWGEDRLPLDRPVRLALSNVDYVVSVVIDGEPVDSLRSTPKQYDITAQGARELMGAKTPPRLGVAAQDVRACFAHLLIERDVFYTADPREGRSARSMYGARDNPITLRADEYFVLGDNSPSSLDGRFAFAQVGEDPVGPHLRRNGYKPGTVPADQLIGPAFLVYWPGMDALVPDQLLPRWLRLINQLPSPGRIRWIH